MTEYKYVMSLAHMFPAPEKRWCNYHLDNFIKTKHTKNISILASIFHIIKIPLAR